MAYVSIDWPSKDSPQKKEIVDLITIGRGADCDIVLDEDCVSSRHACVRKEQDEYFLIDLNSVNGVFLNGEQVDEAKLKDGDVIRIDMIPGVFHDDHQRNLEERKAASVSEDPHKSEYTKKIEIVDETNMIASKSPTLDDLVRSDNTLIHVERDEGPRAIVRTCSSLAVAGGVLGPLLLGIGWLLGIGLGLVVLAGYRGSAEREDRVMAGWGLLTGVIWLVGIYLAVRFVIKLG